MRGRRISQRGNAALEMALVTLPLLFLIFSTIEMGRCMWTYHTLAAAVKRGTRFAVVHGANCVDASSACQTTIGDATQAIEQSGFGLDAAKLELVFSAGSQSQDCNPASSCASDTTPWPASPNNGTGQAVTVNGTYTFQSVLSVFWPGQTFNSFTLSAKSTEVIQF